MIFLDYEENRELADFILSLIKKEIKKEFDKLQFVNTYTGKVVGIGTGTLNVKLAGSDVILSGLKNKIDSSVTVNLNDEVVLVCLKNSLTNSFVAWKK